MEGYEKMRVLLVYRRYTSSFIAYPSLLSRQGGFSVDVIAPKSHLIKYAKWTRRTILVEDDDKFIQALIKAISCEDYIAVLAIDEPARKLLLDASDHPEIKPYLPKIEGAVNFDVALSKQAFASWCLKHGLATPRTRFCPTRDLVLERVCDFAYPFILKGDEGAGGQQVFRIHNREELEQVLEEYSAIGQWLLQEYCSGPVGTTIFVAKDGVLYGDCSFINRVSTANGLGPAAVCEYMNTPELTEAAERVASYVDGFTGYDWILRADGKIVLIDPHFGRAAPTGAVAHLFGVNLGVAYANSLSASLPIQKIKSARSIVWIFPQCLQLIMEGRVSEIFGPYGPFRGKSCIFLFARGEWKMFLLQLFDYILGKTRVVLGFWRRKLLGQTVKRSHSYRL